MKKKVGGWHRIWILLSVIYFFVVTGFAVYVYPEKRNEVRRLWVLETIELTLSKHKELFIGMAMKSLKKTVASSEFREGRIYFGIFDLKIIYGIDVVMPSPFIDQSNKSYSIKLFSAGSEPIKTLKFSINENPSMIVAEVEKYYRKLNMCNAKRIKWALYNDLNDKQIIYKLHEEYQNKFDFSAIDARHKKRFREFIFKFVLIAFSFWITPIISLYLVVYIIFVSIKWIIRGFREK